MKEGNSATPCFSPPFPLVVVVVVLVVLQLIGTGHIVLGNLFLGDDMC